MDDFTPVFKILSGGADGVTLLIAYFLWRIERRVLALEIEKKADG